MHRNALVARDAMRALERRPAAGSRGDAVGDAGADGAADGGAGWAVLVHPVGEWLAVSRRHAAAVREAMRQVQPR